MILRIFFAFFSGVALAALAGLFGMGALCFVRQPCRIPSVRCLCGDHSRCVGLRILREVRKAPVAHQRRLNNGPAALEHFRINRILSRCEVACRAKRNVSLFAA